MSIELDQAGRDAMTAAGWNVSETAAQKTFTFKNFVEAFGWMTSAAITHSCCHILWTHNTHRRLS